MPFFVLIVANDMRTNGRCSAKLAIFRIHHSRSVRFNYRLKDLQRESPSFFGVTLNVKIGLFFSRTGAIGDVAGLKLIGKKVKSWVCHQGVDSLRTGTDFT